MIEAEDSASVPMPAGLPEPGVYPDGGLEPEVRAAAELATFATGWAMLHEVRHVQHQQDGTSAPYDAAPEQVHAEEFSCDAFATTFLLERAADYAHTAGVEAHRVHQKRQTGIYFALLTMALIGAERWEESEEHPALGTRMDRVVEHMAPWRTKTADAIGSAAFEALGMRWPSVPRLTKAVDRWA